ncbi:scarecrow-like protein 23 [Brachypodium distachyon]|uniref:Uncharacterized protein n=1 Tax=Brachypodium distachyon TaxID=15368 RepID=I1IXU0_BRADI|nr:scarecrow-like protein 23 [Brachypodium distachyon]KQJ82663.2 hypothetical protein BRADI_5g10320v3 [Brachypodium distachyon]|eukprot:XP_010227137.1 scarecrow-like protein 23 [Brachypodium distachyon]
MNLTLSLGVDGGGAAAKKRKVRDGDVVGAAGDGGDYGRIMRLLQARDRVAKVKLGDQYGNDDDGSRGGGGLRLMRLLLSSAAAAEVGDAHAAAVALREVSRHASFRGGDPVQRVAAHFADALASRLLLSPRAPAPIVAPRATPAEQSFLAFTMFYQASPFYQFAHFTANQAILEAFEAGARRSLHVVDFDVSFGFQWPSLIQSLSDAAATTSPQSSDNSDAEPQPAAAFYSLRITGFGTSADELRDTEARLARFAAGCPNLRFEFEGIVNNNGSALHGLKNIKVDPDSTVVVNLVFPAATTTTTSSLACVRSLNPSLVFLIDKDVQVQDSASLLPRFAASLRYYAAVFESLHECLPADSAERLAIERDHLGAEIGHAMASLQGDRRQHGGDWTEVMEGAGFEGARLSSRTVSQAKLLLKMKSGGCGGFRVIECGGEDKAMSLGWRDRALITATAWRPCRKQNDL